MNNNDKKESLTLEILQAIEQNNDVTQRHLASHLGVALGLANSYLKRCVRKGLVKIQHVPANRYLYYLTPKGFAEKSRLTAKYLSI
ncbi:MAG: winged helix-turn-helix transcriptional regulator, partial [Gammaproteobacteria bacterium]|nr:winged helix-turn-helix transcriptional regulator [Gammaproteobacteria bacterium]NIQ74958.1 winged helix-turn-helix transcriptional regulator [Gammaproteobacteria bacterium]NIR95555.1 winged helix-turn-helix transcriptional regulator [Gammaproteobacteria bacterium]NIV26204.1 winged helix-turn-helix transcriptional regulator [Gammaproteobacteria bacterium]NIW09331.1 winged helix-turn-helix transcriptional regulator [Gammaproteobacteria bacterium]